MRKSTVLATVFTFACVAILGIGLGACKKKPKDAKKTADNTPSMTSDGPMAMTPPPMAGMAGMAPMTAMAPAKAPTSAASACAKGGAHPGQTFSKDQFTVSVKAPAAAVSGAAAQAEITVVPKGGYKYNLKYPTELSLKFVPAGVDVARKLYEKGHAKITKGQAQVVVAFTPRKAGKLVFRAEMDLSVCTPKLCVTEQACVAWETTAK